MKTKIKEKFKNIYTEFKKDKVLQIALVFAIISAILGCVDLKVNAAESGYAVVSVKTEHRFTDTSGTTYVSGFPLTQAEQWTFSSESPISVYYYNTSDTVTTTSDYKIFIYYVSDSPLYAGESSAGYSTTVNGKTVYYCASNSTSRNYSSNAGYCTMDFQGASNVYRLTDAKYYTATTFVTALQNGTLEYEQEIDYDSFEIDDDMSTIQNLLYNIIRNEKPSENDTTGLGIIKDVEYYEYLTWNNTKNLPIQVEYVPIVQIYSGLIKETFKKEYYGEWTDFEILSADTNSYTKRTDSEYLYENDRVGKDFEDEILNTYVEYGDNTYLFYGYRLRYVDENSKLCSPWVYAVPRENGTYYSYVEYSDSSTTDDENITGTDNTYDNIDDIENAKTDIDKENEVKNEYEIVDGDVDVQEATNWLNTVVSFIKGTPQVVGSVLGFLPQPILYGMYVTIFLGVIASAIAIVKALF